MTRRKSASVKVEPSPSMMSATRLAAGATGSAWRDRRAMSGKELVSRAPRRQQPRYIARMICGETGRGALPSGQPRVNRASFAFSVRCRTCSASAMFR